jgi:hypothetical protein
VVVDEAVDTELIKKPNVIITDTSMCLLNRAIDTTLGKNPEVWLCGGVRHMAKNNRITQLKRLTYVRVQHVHD